MHNLRHPSYLQQFSLKENFDESPPSTADSSEPSNENSSCPHVEKMPVNKSEPEVNDTKWKNFQAFNNCYAYMLDDNSSQYHSKPQPGSRYYDMKSRFHDAMEKHYLSLQQVTDDPTMKKIYGVEQAHNAKAKRRSDNKKVLPNRAISCQVIQDRMALDNDITFITNTEAETQPCPTGYYKAFVAVAPASYTYGADYHFYRQNPDGTWSHKPGGREVSHVDAANCPIWNPAKANRKYSVYDYSEPCSFFCVPNNHTADTNIL